MKRLDEIPLSRRDRVAILEATSVLRRLAPVEQIILFGSKSRGDDDAESDIDLLVVTRRPLSRIERDAATDALFAVELAHDVVLSVVDVSSEEWQSGLVSVLPIHDEVEEQGVLA